MKEVFVCNVCYGGGDNGDGAGGDDDHVLIVYAKIMC